MVQEVLYTFASVIIVSFVSLVGILSIFFHKKKNLGKVLMLLVSLSAGTLFGGAFLHILPEVVEESGGFTLEISLTILAGILVFFILEKIVHMNHHHHHCHHQENLPIQNGKEHIGVLNLFGDGLHNFLDGLIIAGSYLISLPLGIATTVAVILHEVPQELADFGVLLYAGFTKRKALILNFLSAAVAILGAIVGLILGSKGEAFVHFILPFAAGGFLYIAGSNLIPELHKHCKIKESLWHLLAMVVGIVIMVGLLFL